MSNALRSILFAAVLCIVCSGLLTLASTGLKGLQDSNVALDKQKNILKAAGLIDAGGSDSPEAIERLYRDKIRTGRVDRQGRITAAPDSGADGLPVYLYVEQDQIRAYILPVDSRGLWGRIYGYLAMKNDGATVYGFTVYSHSETPGLGGEIERDWFQKNFRGKTILDRQGAFVSVGIAKGPAADSIPAERQSNFVDGISGASLTGKFLTQGLKRTLADYEPLSLKFRQAASDKAAAN